MGFNCGIVGLPNVGKSTLFNALTKTAGSDAPLRSRPTRSRASSTCTLCSSAAMYAATDGSALAPPSVRRPNQAPAYLSGKAYVSGGGQSPRLGFAGNGQLSARPSFPIKRLGM